MIIQCTKKLLDQLKIKPDMGVEEDPLFSWHANLLTINRRKVLVFVNDKNRYSIVLYGLKAKDFKNFDEHIISSIRKTFQQECIKEEIIDQFINSASEITYTKTKNRSMISRMNESCKNVHYYLDLLDERTIYQGELSQKISRYIVGDRQGDYIYPNKEMYQDLRNLTGEKVFTSKAAVIKVTLELENYNVWRKLIIPTNISFSKLHQILQIAFEWQDYHLHEFYIYDNAVKKESLIYYSDDYDLSLKPIINLVSSEEDLDYQDLNDYEMKLEKGIKLSEYLPAKIKYIYDYGDDWEHSIEIQEIIDDYDKNYPICFDGKGNTPPEDVGGEGGFEEFLKIIADSNHPEHQFLLEWGEKQGYQDFDIEEINQDLKIMF
ncbi:plasmid pRiA4b ORF-3 family protein [Natronospora cellulosivora (SeqCode)]